MKSWKNQLLQFLIFSQFTKRISFSHQIMILQGVTGPPTLWKSGTMLQVGHLPQKWDIGDFCNFHYFSLISTPKIIIYYYTMLQGERGLKRTLWFCEEKKVVKVEKINFWNNKCFWVLTTPKIIIKYTFICPMSSGAQTLRKSGT